MGGPGFKSLIVLCLRRQDGHIGNLKPFEAKGSGGGTSGRAMAFSLGRPGSNPGTDIGFFQFRIASGKHLYLGYLNEVSSVHWTTGCPKIEGRTTV